MKALTKKTSHSAGTTTALLCASAMAGLTAGSGQAQTPFTLDFREAGRNGVELELLGEEGKEYRLETAPGLDEASWAPLVTTRMGGDPLRWIEAGDPQERQRYFRAVRLPDFYFPETVEPFRLTDHTGTSQALEYQAHRSAVVLCFVDEEALQDAEVMAELQAIKAAYAESGVVFWLVSAASPHDRAALVPLATTDLPILHDTMRLVTQDNGVAVLPEVIAIDAKTRFVFYRGAMEHDGVNRLQAALDHHLAGEPIATRYVRPTGRQAMEVVPEGLAYTEDIAPILQKHCVACHSLGNIAPFSMDSYEAVVDWAPAIKEEVLEQSMPPWHADPEYGEFVNDSSIDPDEASKLVAWVNQGTPRGEGDDPLATISAADQIYPLVWPEDLGEPDHIVSIPRQNLPATGEVDYRYLDVPLDLPEDVWLKAAIVLPGNLEVVHHALIFDGSLVEFAGGLSGFFAGYVPGATPSSYPKDTGKFLSKNQSLLFQMHYITTGTATSDETKLGLYLADAKPKRELLTKAAFSLNIAIPPHAFDHELTAERTFTRDALLYELNPHMHYRGSRFRYEAHYPDGTSEILLSVPKYWFDWQRDYRFREPLFMPAGTKIRCVGAFDNTRHNHENPDPTQTVFVGEQTGDEMFIGYMNFAELP